MPTAWAPWFGKVGNADHDDCVRMVHRALDADINFVDTADVYGYGWAQEIDGKVLKRRRNAVVSTTKLSGPMGEGSNRSGSSRRWIVSVLEGSLIQALEDHAAHAPRRVLGELRVAVLIPMAQLPPRGLWHTTPGVRKPALATWLGRDIAPTPP